MSVSIMDLWLAILLAGVFCWIASALIHILIKYHNSDYKKLANEDEVTDALRKGKPSRGLYSLPHCADMNEMASSPMKEKFEQGPVAFITIFKSGLPDMKVLLTQQLLFFVIGCLLVAYVASLSLAVGSDYMSVFRLVFVVAFLAFGWGLIPFSIWYGHPWSNSVRYLIDAAIYAGVTAATFAWFWPALI